MLEQIFRGSNKYWYCVSGLLILIAFGVFCYFIQWDEGLGITGMSRDVSWGLYIANFTFFVGVAASAVLLVIPYYLHNQKSFTKIIIFGEFLAVAAVVTAVSFVLVDLGQPSRVLNMLLYPSPDSILFWDLIVLTGYLIINIIIGWTMLDSENKEEVPPGWIKPLILLSIPWAISIHTVTAFIYCGLAARPFWLTALLAPRFLASAFASGPSLLILITLLLRKLSVFDVGAEAIQKVVKIVIYASIATLFFLILEIFTISYSQLPEHMKHLQYLIYGIGEHIKLVPYFWTSCILLVVSIALLIIFGSPMKEYIVAVSCLFVFIGIWIDKGLGLIVPGFIPSPTDLIYEYWPTLPESAITMGIWAGGALVLTLLYKITISIRRKIT